MFILLLITGESGAPGPPGHPGSLDFPPSMIKLETNAYHVDPRRDTGKSLSMQCNK